MSGETIDKIQSYFAQGHSPASALHLHNLNLGIQYDKEDGQLEKVRSLNPLYTDVYYLFRKWRVHNLGETNGKHMFHKLQEMVKTYNAKHGSDGGNAFLQQ